MKPQTNMNKKITAMIIVMAMILSLIPTNITLADTETDTEYGFQPDIPEVTQTENSMKILGINYKELEDGDIKVVSENENLIKNTGRFGKKIYRYRAFHR